MSTTLELSTTAERIAQAVPFGAGSAIKREALAAQLGMSDRMMRKAIQTARDEGVIILNAQDGHGYFQSANLGELEAQYRQDTARAMAILKRRKALRKILKEAGVQV